MKHSTTNLASSQKSKWLQKNLMGKEKKNLWHNQIQIWNWSNGGQELEDAKSLRCSMLWYLTGEWEKDK